VPKRTKLVLNRGAKRKKEWTDNKLRCLTLSLRTEKVRKELLESVKEKEKRKCTSVKREEK
jgi:hypothetical protein